MIPPLHFTYNPMQQTGADHFVLAKLRRNVLKESVAVGYRHRAGARCGFGLQNLAYNIRRLVMLEWLAAA